MIEQPETLFIGVKTFSKIEMQHTSSNAKVAVVIDEGGAELSPAQSELLFKILASVKVSEQEVVILNSANTQVSISVIKNNFAAQYALVFSTNAKALGENLLIPVYEVFTIDEVKVLRAASIAKIMTNAEHKSVLWKCLRQMFEL
jgi:DNA polymerase III psi subunit